MTVMNEEDAFMCLTVYFFQRRGFREFKKWPTNTLLTMYVVYKCTDIIAPSSDDWAVEAGMWRKLRESDSYSIRDVHLQGRTSIPSVLRGKMCLQTTVQPLFPFTGAHSCMCIIQAEDSCGGRNQELTWLSLYDSVNSLFLCVPRPCILETLSCLPPLISLSPGQHALSSRSTEQPIYWTQHDWLNPMQIPWNKM